jgi:hypothetical protein
VQETGEIVKDLSVLSVEDLITKDIDELRQQVLENREKAQQQLRGGSAAQRRPTKAAAAATTPGIPVESSLICWLLPFI